MELQRTPAQDTEQNTNKQEHFELAFLGGHGRAALPTDLLVLMRILAAPAPQGSKWRACWRSPRQNPHQNEHFSADSQAPQGRMPTQRGQFIVFLSGQIPAFFHPIVDLFQPLPPLGRGESFGIL